jgi:hypothetical protein
LTQLRAHLFLAIFKHLQWWVQDADAESRMPHEWRLSSGDEAAETTEPKL